MIRAHARYKNTSLRAGRCAQHAGRALPVPLPVSQPASRAQGLTNRQMVASAPAVKAQGWVGWKATSSTPRKSTTSWPRRILTAGGGGGGLNKDFDCWPGKAGREGGRHQFHGRWQQLWLHARHSAVAAGPSMRGARRERQRRPAPTRHDEGVGHQVGVHAAVEDVHGAVVGGGGKEGVGAVEGGAAHGVAVVPERAVRLGGQVQVEPAAGGGPSRWGGEWGVGWGGRRWTPRAQVQWRDGRAGALLAGCEQQRAAPAGPHTPHDRQHNGMRSHLMGSTAGPHRSPLPQAAAAAPTRGACPRRPQSGGPPWGAPPWR